jgi:glycerol uptake facilitator-like aquaporin
MHQVPAARQGPAAAQAAPSPLLVVRNSALEFLLALVLLFGVTGIVRWVVGPSPVSRAVPQIEAELVIIGGAVAVLLAALVVSPAGRRSGGHMNPAITLAMWRLGVFPGVSVAPYAVAQLAGSLVGVLAARALWGGVIDSPPVSDAVLQPGPGWSSAALFAVEGGYMLVTVLLTGLFLSQRRLAPLVPALVGLLVGLAIAVFGTLTGGCVNPARQFGPAMVSGNFGFLWVYLVAPTVGGFVAAALWTAFTRHRLLTHRLCGTHADGSPL